MDTCWLSQLRLRMLWMRRTRRHRASRHQAWEYFCYLRAGTRKILDFGLAKSCDASEAVSMSADATASNGGIAAEI